MVKYLAGFAGGVVIGYFGSRTYLKKLFNERLAQEIIDLDEFHKAKWMRRAAKDYVGDPEFQDEAIKAAAALSSYMGIPVDPTTLVEDLTAVVERNEEPEADEDDWDRSQQDHEEVKAAEQAKPAPPVTIVPEQPVGAVNYNRISTPSKKEDLVKARTEVTVVPIDKNEFINNVSGFEQTTVTYFAGDDRLANIHDQVITEDAREEFLGTEIFDLLKSPEARGGEDTVYTRNIPREREFEIIISPGNYADEVGEVVYATG